MVAFNKDDYQRLDLQIMKNGAISLFYDQRILDETCAWFREQAYQIDSFDASRWKSEYDFYDDMYGKLGLGPSESSLDALNDSLVDLAIPYESGRLLVFQDFQRFARRDKRFAQQVLDILQHTSRHYSLYGYRLLTFIQGNDPHMTFESVDAVPVVLNPTELARRFREQMRRAQERERRKHRVVEKGEKSEHAIYSASTIVEGRTSGARSTLEKDIQKYTVWIEAEAWETGWDPDDSNTDVALKMPDGSRWMASFFSYKNITTLIEKDKRTGENLSGAYFWSDHLILIDRVTRQQIEMVIKDLIETETFESVFEYFPPEDED